MMTSSSNGFVPMSGGASVLRRPGLLAAVAEHDYLCKCIVVGDSGVGKSMLVHRFADRVFTANYISTIGVDFEVRYVSLGDKVAKLQLWDTAGQERFSSIVKSYYRGAQCLVIVFDVTDRRSFNSITRRWLPEIRNYAVVDQCEVMMVGNKSDLDAQRVVSREEAEELAADLNISYIETSAKNNIHIDEAFVQVASNYVSKHAARLADAKKEKRAKRFRVRDAEDIDSPRKGRLSCCTIM